MFSNSKTFCIPQFWVVWRGEGVFQQPRLLTTVDINSRIACHSLGIKKRVNAWRGNAWSRALTGSPFVHHNAKFIKSLYTNGESFSRWSISRHRACDASCFYRRHGLQPGPVAHLQSGRIENVFRHKRARRRYRRLSA